jgi:hypothetical protein
MAPTANRPLIATSSSVEAPKVLPETAESLPYGGPFIDSTTVCAARYCGGKAMGC